MRFTTPATIALAARAVSAFKDASPLMLFSTSELLLSSPQITTSDSLTPLLQSSLSSCPSNIYILAHQPAASSEDYNSHGATPNLAGWMSASSKDRSVKSSTAVSEVMGSIDAAKLQDLLEQKCGATAMVMDVSTGLLNIDGDSKPRVIRVDFPALPVEANKRRLALREHDLFLANLVDMLPTDKWTVLYATSAGEGAVESGTVRAEEAKEYQMDSHHQNLMHQELKRDLGVQRRWGNESLPLRDGGLFERYQFFTPGIFMGLITMFFLIIIIFVAINAIGNLQVTYGAFEKESGPSSQQKKQQ